VDNDKIKKLISLIETDNNPEAVHEMQTEGIHAGTRAFGQYGLMPITAQEMAAKGENDLLDKLIQKSEPQSVGQILADNPHKEEEYVDRLLKKIQEKSKGDLTEELIRWKHGQNLKKAKVREIKGRDQQLMKRIDDKIKQQSETEQEEPAIQIPEYNKIMEEMKQRDIIQSFPKLKERLK
jgi:hypothetical protein